MKCFYHSVDQDGYCSAAIVSYFHNHKDVEFIGIDYGDAFPWESIRHDEIVYMVDFALQPFSDMLRLNKMCNLVWIDHHKTAIKDSKECGIAFNGLQRIGLGACCLVWEHLFPEEGIPRAVRLLGEYDVWDHENPETIPFQYGMRNLGWDPQEMGWTTLFGNDYQVTKIAEMGQFLMDYMVKENAKLAKILCFSTELDGLRLLAANTGPTNSKFFDSMWDPNKYDAVCPFYWKADIGQFTVHLFTEKIEIDVGSVSRAHGGGGHKNASGFQCTELPFRLSTSL